MNYQQNDALLGSYAINLESQLVMGEKCDPYHSTHFAQVQACSKITPLMLRLQDYHLISRQAVSQKHAYLLQNAIKHRKINQFTSQVVRICPQFEQISKFKQLQQQPYNRPQTPHQGNGYVVGGQYAQRPYPINEPSGQEKFGFTPITHQPYGSGHQYFGNQGYQNGMQQPMQVAGQQPVQPNLFQNNMNPQQQYGGQTTFQSNQQPPTTFGTNQLFSNQPQGTGPTQQNPQMHAQGHLFTNGGPQPNIFGQQLQNQGSQNIANSNIQNNKQNGQNQQHFPINNQQPNIFAQPQFQENTAPNLHSQSFQQSLGAGNHQAPFGDQIKDNKMGPQQAISNLQQQQSQQPVQFQPCDKQIQFCGNNNQVNFSIPQNFGQQVLGQSSLSSDFQNAFYLHMAPGNDPFSAINPLGQIENQIENMRSYNIMQQRDMDQEYLKHMIKKQDEKFHQWKSSMQDSQKIQFSKGGDYFPPSLYEKPFQFKKAEESKKGGQRPRKRTSQFSKSQIQFVVASRIQASVKVVFLESLKELNMEIAVAVESKTSQLRRFLIEHLVREKQLVTPNVQLYEEHSEILINETLCAEYNFSKCKFKSVQINLTQTKSVIIPKGYITPKIPEDLGAVRNFSISKEKLAISWCSAVDLRHVNFEEVLEPRKEAIQLYNMNKIGVNRVPLWGKKLNCKRIMQVLIPESNWNQFKYNHSDKQILKQSLIDLCNENNFKFLDVDLDQQIYKYLIDY